MKFWFSFPKLVAFIFISTSLLVVSCGKEKSLTGTDAQEEEVSKAAGESSAEAETTFNEFFDDAMGASNDVGVAGSGVFYNRPDSLTPVPRCFTIIITRPTNNPFPVIIELDFGTTGCPGPDGKVRRGKIIMEYTNHLNTPGAIAITTFDGFYVDAIHVEGKHKITNISTTPVPPVNMTRKFKVEVIDGKLSWPDGNFIEWDSDKTVTQFEGLGTPNYPKDDGFKIEGAAEGYVKKGNLLVRWGSTITEPLVRRLTCRWIVKGRIRTVRANLPNPTTSHWAAVLDFGLGNCDNQATITIKGIPRQITLP